MKTNKKVAYIVIAICIICMSVIPCYAVTGTYATTRNFEAVPIYFKDVIIGHYIDEQTGMDYLNRSMSWGTAIAYGYFFEQYEDGNTYTNISTIYDADKQNIDISVFKHSQNNEIPGYTSTGIDAIYTINSGNYLINTAEDEFNFEISTNMTCLYTIAGTYTVLSEDNTNSENVQYFAINGTTANRNIEFDLCEHLSTLIGNDAEVIINALTIEWETVDLVTDYFTTNIIWEQSSSVAERNMNGANINYNGTVENSELNYYNTINESFGNMGVERYKSSFVNYTSDYTSWIGEAVGGFLNMEIFPYFSIGGILLICVAIGLVGYFLKVFMGG